MLIPLGRQWTVAGRRTVSWSRFLSYSWLNVCNNLISFEFWPFWPSLRIEWFSSSSSRRNSHLEMTNNPIKCIADCCHLTTHIYIILWWDWQLEPLLAGIMECSLLLPFDSVFLSREITEHPGRFFVFHSAYKMSNICSGSSGNCEYQSSLFIRFCTTLEGPLN